MIKRDENGQYVLPDRKSLERSAAFLMGVTSERAERGNPGGSNTTVAMSHCSSLALLCFDLLDALNGGPIPEEWDQPLNPSDPDDPSFKDTGEGTVIEGTGGEIKVDAAANGAAGEATFRNPPPKGGIRARTIPAKPAPAAEE